MSYLVLARKWRPKYFEEVVGQEHVARTLENSIEQDRVHHAYLFCGARGVGKTSTARILAKSLNCAEGPTARPCYDCQSCQDITEGQSVDVYEIDGASNRGINEIRELREGVRYAPSQGRFKIYIIDEVHMLTTEAFNALLKTLEEPPEHAYFIFATTEPQKIPITILSRCQRFDFKRISQSEIVDHLAMICGEEGIEAERAALQLMARQADGAMRDALSLLDQVIGFAGDRVEEGEVADILGVANREHLFEISRAILRRDAREALAALDVVDRYGYDLQQFASELVSHLRDLTVTAAVDEPERVTDLTESELAEARDQIETMSVEEEARRQLLHRYFSVMADGAREMTRSPYPKLIFEMTLVRLTDLEPLMELDVLVDRLDALEEEFEGDPPPAGSRDAGGGPPTQSSTSSPADSRADALSDPGAEAESTGREGHGDGREADGASSRERGESEDGDGSASADVDEDEDPEEAMADPAGGLETAPDPTGDFEDEESEISDEKSDRNEAAGAPPASAEPVEGGEDESVSADPAELEPGERWERVVETIRERRGSTGVKFEHAHPEDFADGAIVLGCEPQYASFFERDDHLEEIAETAAEIFGGEWEVDLEPWSVDGEEGEGRETLAERREADHRERVERLESDVRENAVVRKAQNLFDLDDDHVRVDVEIDD